ncbi:hypothetical protein ACROYT_G008594 [Oculina patagonica]
MFILRISIYAMLPLLFTNRSSSSTINLSRRKRLSSFIYPGTKWCGMGNEAKSYKDLGMKIKTDKCCRAHDNCKHYIPAFGSIGEVKNDLPYTVSHCDCDSDFYQCLKVANTETAKKVGEIFFNVLKVPCFVWQNEDCHEGKCQEQKKAVLQHPKQFR